MQSLPSSSTSSRRAIEALRAGVPNRNAVEQLGCSQPEIEDKFAGILGELAESRASGAEPPPGLLFSGDFGSGKSHLLQYLQHMCLERGFVASKVVISKETSFADPARLFRAAVEEARLPDKIGPALVNVANSLNFNSQAYARFNVWLSSQDSGLASHFPASIYVHEYGQDAEFSDSIIRFWSGDPLSNRDLRNKLRELGQHASFDLARLPGARDLALQRFRFASQLMMAAGYAGWVLLIDEAELLAVYSFKQRARAYVELARWLGHLRDADNGVFPGMTAVVAMTGDFDARVLQFQGSRPGDLELIPGRLRQTGRPDDELLATLAIRGMRAIQNRHPLSALRLDYVEKAHESLKRVYSQAFQWPAPTLDLGFSGQATAVMRPLVRRWITEWDIRRLYPGYTFQPRGYHQIADASYSQDPDLNDDDN